VTWHRTLLRHNFGVAMVEPISDGVVELRAPRAGDSTRLIEGRDEVFHRFLGPGSSEPQPTACIVVGGEVVGWVDYDVDRRWLAPEEVNVGYNVFAEHRGKGYATRAVELLMRHFAEATDYSVATLLIDPANERSLALAARAGFTRVADLDGNRHFKRTVQRRDTVTPDVVHEERC